MIKRAMVALILVVIASLLVAGCIGADTDNSKFYNSVNWGGNSVIEKPFYKTQSERGNALYIGVVRNKTTNVLHTYSFEEVRGITNSELIKAAGDASKLYDDTVASAKLEEYTTKISAPSTRFQHWQGVKSNGTTLDVQCYKSGDVNSWVVVKEYWR